MNLFALFLKQPDGFGKGFLDAKSNCTCSCPFGCCSRHSSRRGGGISERTALVQWIFAWHAGHGDCMES